VRRPGPRPLSAALAQTLAAAEPQTTLAAVQRAWPGVVGERIAAEARPAAERGGTVTVECRSAVWAQELELMSEDLLGRLADALAGPPAPSRLRFVVGGRAASS